MSLAEHKNWRAWTHIEHLWTFAGLSRKEGRYPKESDLEPLSDATIVVDSQGCIAWLGPSHLLPASLSPEPQNIYKMEPGHITPAFIECHTHSLFAGNRSQELDWRNQGLSYQDITARGGGIYSTVKQTRAASDLELRSILLKHLQGFSQQGVALVEVKTGYGLNPREELRQLQLIREAQSDSAVKLVSTFLGAHALPPEYKSWGAYLESYEPFWPEIQSLTRRVDIFIESGFCTIEDAKPFLKKAQSVGLEICIHAEQLSRQGSAELALELGARSIEHAIHINSEDIEKLAKSSTVVNLLPTADLYLRCPYPPARKLIDSGAIVALSTDFNPGTAFSQSLGLVGLLARLEMKMSLPEVWSAYTFGAAKSLGMETYWGSLEVGKQFCVNLWHEHPFELFYSADPLRPEMAILGSG
ncbi:MAG: imidazolonepropionase [Bdellovibrionaceae bacterium]|nr:imidazolonepropionase [Pseudobdellovibrionaceae bacterium]